MLLISRGFALAFLILTWTSSIRASTKVGESTSKVIALNGNNFDAALLSDELWIIKFFAPWCNYCIRMAPMWEELSNVQSDARMAKVDCTTSTDLRDKYKIESYPTIKYIKHGVLHDYHGPRSKEAFLSFIQKMKGHYVSEIKTRDEIQDLFPSVASEQNQAARSHGTGVVSGGVVFLLTIRRPPRSATLEENTLFKRANNQDPAALEARFTDLVEEAYEKVAKKMHAEADFAILKEESAVSGSGSVGGGVGSNSKYSVELSLLERDRKPRVMSIQILRDAFFGSNTQGMENEQTLDSIADKIEHFVNHTNFGLITELDSYNFRRIANLNQLMVIGIVSNGTQEGGWGVDWLMSTIRGKLSGDSTGNHNDIFPNKYAHVDKDGVIAAMDHIVSHSDDLTMDSLNTTGASPLIFGYLEATKWKRFLKQYRAKAPGILLLGSEFREPGWSFRYFSLKKQALDNEEKGQKGQTAKSGTAEAEEDREVINEIEAKIIRIIRRVQENRIVFTSKVRPGGFINGIMHHISEQFTTYYPWSLLMLVPVFILIITLVLPSPTIPKASRKKKSN